MCTRVHAWSRQLSIFYIRYLSAWCFLTLLLFDEFVVLDFRSFVSVDVPELVLVLPSPPPPDPIDDSVFVMVVVVVNSAAARFFSLFFFCSPFSVSGVPFLSLFANIPSFRTPMAASVLVEVSVLAPLEAPLSEPAPDLESPPAPDELPPLPKYNEYEVIM